MPSKLPPNPPFYNPQRRRFLRDGFGALGAAGLAGCGGGGGASPALEEGAQANALAVTLPQRPTVPTIPAPAPAPAPTSTPTPTAPVALDELAQGAMQFSLKAATAQAAAPFCVGFAFRQGDVPAGSNVTSTFASVQVTVRNRWPDGSLKFAQIAGRASVPAGQAVAIRLEATSSAIPSGTALSTADLRRTGAKAEVGCGDFGTVSWIDADWDNPFDTWVSGPLMSSWIYRKPVGKDPHLVAWLEVRLYAGGQVEVLPWIENGYLRVAAPVNKLANYTFSLGGTQRFSGSIDLKSHQRTVLINGTALSWWLAADPGVAVRHDPLYLQATELVPSYRARTPATAEVLTRLSASYQPLQSGNFNFSSDDMGSTGYQEPIGLLPLHDVCYLTSSSDLAYGAVVRNGFSAGRYAVHYRDETTQRPLRFIRYPNLVISNGSGFKDNGDSSVGQLTPTVSGPKPPGWDVAHSPSVGFMAYLLTGRFYFLEETQFVTTAHYLGKSDTSTFRNGSQGLVRPVNGAWQTRSCAWDWRSLTQALCITPDNDVTIRDELIRVVEANIQHFHDRYVAQPNNPFGFVEPGGYYSDHRFEANWMQDFVTAAFGYSVSMGLPLSDSARTRLAAFFRWKAQSVVRRLGTRSGFWYVNAAPYTMSISPSNTPDYAGGKGPWYATDAEVYAATYANRPTWLSTTEGVLASEIMPGERAYWGNLMPALAYAVRHGVPGAQASYNRVISASNWPALRDAFDSQPVWAVEPARQNPAWLANAPLHTWVRIDGTEGAGGSAVIAFSGMAYNEQSNEILIAAAGGHGDSADNRVVSLRLTDDQPRWQQRMAPSTSTQRDAAYYADGKPSARHLYQSIHFVAPVQRLMLFGARFVYGSAVTFNKVDGFNLDTQRWDPAGTWPDTPGAHGACMVRATGEVWTGDLKRWSPSTGKWSDPLVSRVSSPAPLRWPLAHDSRRNQLFALQVGDGQGYAGPTVYASRVNLGTMKQTAVTLKSSAALSTFQAEQASYAAMDYDVANDRFLFYSGLGAAAGRVYAVKPVDADTGWEISVLQLAGTPPPSTPENGIHSRFRYVPALKGFVLLATPDAPLYFFRVA